MGRTFFTQEETQAYHEGRNDEKHHRRDRERNRHDYEDNAYFKGIDDEAHEERMREEERMLEEEREKHERMEYEKYLEEQEYYDDAIQSQLDDAEVEEMSDLNLILEDDIFTDSFFNDDEDDE